MVIFRMEKGEAGQTKVMKENGKSTVMVARRGIGVCFKKEV